MFWYGMLTLINAEKTLLMQIQLPARTPAAAEAEPAQEAATTPAAEPEQLPDGLLQENTDRATAATSALPDLAPAELPPAEHAMAPQAAQIQTHSSVNQGQHRAALAQGTGRFGAPGLLPKLKVQIETLEDKELEMRL